MKINETTKVRLEEVSKLLKQISEDYYGSGIDGVEQTMLIHITSARIFIDHLLAHQRKQ